MEKKIVVLVHLGLPYRKTIKYANMRARDMGAKLTLLGIIPDFVENNRVALATYGLASYKAVAGSVEKESVEFFERVVQFCLDNSITVNTRIERGNLEEVLKRTASDVNTKLIVVPAPTKHDHHVPFLDTIRQFAHNMLEYDFQCPVVTVLAS